MDRLFLIKFERVGRRRDVPELVVNSPADDADALAAQIHRYVRKFLASSDYEVTLTVDADTGEGSGAIGLGRFGSFTIEDRGDFAQSPSDREAV